MRNLIGLLLLVLIGIPSLSNMASAAVYQKIPGTAVYISTPENFTLSNRFPGFINEKTGSTVLVSSLPEANAAMREIFADREKFSAEMQRQNYLIEDQFETKTSDGFDMKVYVGFQKTAERAYKKWSTMLFLPGVTYVITIQSPLPTGLMDDQVRQMLESIKLSGQDTVEEQVETLPFHFRTEAPFQVAGTIMNSSVMLHIPNYGEEKNDRPDIVISKGFENLDGKTSEQILDIYLASLQGAVDNVDKQTVHAVSFAGQTGLRLDGSGKTKNGEVDLIIYIARIKDGTAIILQATGKKGALQQYGKQINAIAGSVALADRMAD